MSDNVSGGKSARGTGTSGYVQLNLGHKKQDSSTEENYRSRKDLKRKREVERELAEVEKSKNQARELVERVSRRNIEVKCMELRDKLEDLSEDEQDIEEKVAKLRAHLSSNFASESAENEKKNKDYMLTNILFSDFKTPSESSSKPVYEYKPRYEKKD